jgi:hypothetical protein
MWRRWFKWIRYFKTRYKTILVVELHCSDSKTYVRFAERVYGRQVYTKLKTKKYNVSMRLYNDGRAGSNYVISWNEV